MRAYSPLVDSIAVPTGKYYDPSSRSWANKWSDRPEDKLIGLAVHHWASNNMSGFNRLVRSSDPASVNYMILNSGSLVGSVDERNRAWTSGGAERDNQRITVEIQNQTLGPDWRISDAAYDTLVRFYADVANYHDFAPSRANIKGHQELGAATACPGPYLLDRLDDVAREAAALGGNPSRPSNPKPIKPFNPRTDKLDVDGRWGKDTTKKAQFELETVIDGVISNQSRAWKSDNPGLVTGWDWTGESSDSGSNFVRQHQKLLQKRSFYKGKIDGKVGPQYFTALQSDLGTPKDGKVSNPSTMVRAFQRRLNAGKI